MNHTPYSLSSDRRWLMRDGKPHATFDWVETTEQEKDDIVLACNSHDALVAACRAAMQVIGEEGRPVWAQLRDALAAAGEEA